MLPGKPSSISPVKVTLLKIHVPLRVGEPREQRPESDHLDPSASWWKPKYSAVINHLEGFGKRTETFILCPSVSSIRLNRLPSGVVCVSLSSSKKPANSKMNLKSSVLPSETIKPGNCREAFQGQPLFPFCTTFCQTLNVPSTNQGARYCCCQETVRSKFKTSR